MGVLAIVCALFVALAVPLCRAAAAGDRQLESEESPAPGEA